MGQVKVEIKVNGAMFREFYVSSGKMSLAAVSENRSFASANLGCDEKIKLDRQIIIRLGREIIRKADLDNE